MVRNPLAVLAQQFDNVDDATFHDDVVVSVDNESTGDDQHQRPKTMSRREMMREARRRERRGERLQIVDYPRPQTRNECVNGPRPCMYVACKHHLYLDVNPETGSIKINFPDKEVWELSETCALDVAQRGGVTLEEVGEMLNLTRERVRQVEVAGLSKLRERSSLAELDAFLGWDPDCDRE